MKNIMEVQHEGKVFTIAWSFAFLNGLDNSHFYSSLSSRERHTADQFPNRARAAEFAAGRYCAKEAFALYNPGAKQQTADIGIGVWGHPFIHNSDANISIAHTGNCVIAICSNGAFPTGIDIEDCKPSNDALILSQLTNHEKKMVSVSSHNSEMLHILWAAKEAVAKALRTGFRVSMPVFEASSVTQKEDAWHIKFDTIGVLFVIAVNTKSGVLALALPSGSIIRKGFETFCELTSIDHDKKQKNEEKNLS